MVQIYSLDWKNPMAKFTQEPLQWDGNPTVGEFCEAWRVMRTRAAPADEIRADAHGLTAASLVRLFKQINQLQDTVEMLQAEVTRLKESAER